MKFLFFMKSKLLFSFTVYALCPTYKIFNPAQRFYHNFLKSNFSGVKFRSIGIKLGVDSYLFPRLTRVVQCQFFFKFALSYVFCFIDLLVYPYTNFALSLLDWFSNLLSLLIVSGSLCILWSFLDSLWCLSIDSYICISM